MTKTKATPPAAAARALVRNSSFAGRATRAEPAAWRSKAAAPRSRAPRGVARRGASASLAAPAGVRRAGRRRGARRRARARRHDRQGQGARGLARLRRRGGGARLRSTSAACVPGAFASTPRSASWPRRAPRCVCVCAARVCVCVPAPRSTPGAPLVSELRRRVAVRGNAARGSSTAKTASAIAGGAPLPDAAAAARGGDARRVLQNRRRGADCVRGARARVRGGDRVPGRFRRRRRAF